MGRLYFSITCSVEPGRCSTLTIIILLVLLIIIIIIIIIVMIIMMMMVMVLMMMMMMDHIYIYILKVRRHGISKIRNPSAIPARSNVRVAQYMFNAILRSTNLPRLDTPQQHNPWDPGRGRQPFKHSNPAMPRRSRCVATR